MDELDKLDLSKLIKLMKMTTSASDGEALTALRMANAWLSRNSYDWEAVLRGKITIIADPFVGHNAPLKAPNADQSARPSPGVRPAPRPTPPAGGYKPAPKQRPTRQQPPSPAFDPNAAMHTPQPAQPTSKMPTLSFTKNTNGDWAVRSSSPLMAGDVYDVPTRNGGSRPVRIGLYQGTNNYGDHLYAYQLTPRQLGDLA